MLKVEIKNISRHKYGNELSMLNKVNFEISEGKVFTILGKNGSGKTTLIKSITKLLDDNIYKVDGDVFWQNKNIYKMNSSELLSLRKFMIRYVFQDLTNNFDPLKKLAYYFSKTNLNSYDLDKQLADFLLPDLKTLSDLHSYEISGGMAQRLSLMLSIIPNPRLLILDEPTSALDYVNANLLKYLIKEYCSKLNSVIVVTHDMSFAKAISDEIAVLKDKTLSDFVNADNFYETNPVL